MSQRSPKTRLAPCPNRPSCVSTRATDPRHAIAPIPFTGPATRARERLLQILEAYPRTEIVESGKTYLHAVCRSRIFHFPDDVELEIDEAAHLVHFRSCSRYGYGDHGVNRERMEEIRRLFTAR
jgi:uncharacterized protein (DUF1499 family)